MSYNTLLAIFWSAVATVIIVLILTVGKYNSLCKDEVVSTDGFGHICSPGARAEIQGSHLICHCPPK